ncbi:MAG: sigma-70 family RNA polymerase sigma factor [Myxococcota bacterium]
MTTAAATLPAVSRATPPVDVDAELASRAATGDTAAFRELVTRYRRRVYSVALRMLGDAQEAEDLSQDVFVTLFKSLAGFRGESRLSTWIYRVTRNHCLNRIKYLNRRGRQAMVAVGEEGRDVLGELAAPEPSPGRVVLAAEGARRLQAALQTLPPEQRLLVVLREVEQLSYEEMVEATGLPVGTIKSRLHRARAALVEQLPEFKGMDGWQR